MCNVCIDIEELARQAETDQLEKLRQEVKLGLLYHIPYDDSKRMTPEELDNMTQEIVRNFKEKVYDRKQVNS